MKIIYITCPDQDNLEDAVLHGLRSLFGADCVEYPKKERMYRNYIHPPNAPQYGRLFTLWRTLEDIPLDRESIGERIISSDYDLIIFGAIHRSYDLFQQWRPYLIKNKTIVLDGDDLPIVKLGARRFLYFKRELTPKSRYYFTNKLTPRFIYNKLPPVASMRQTAFAIPKEKLTYGVTREDKTRVFPTHIVDDELRTRIPTEAVAADAFEVEEKYYENLRSSKFGITTRRAGWDCLRHYEIAANGTVMCFRDLDAKPKYCAPHGLDRTNTIIYTSADDLLRQIDALSDSAYDRLLESTYAWIENQTTELRAKEILDTAKEYFKR